MGQGPHFLDQEGVKSIPTGQLLELQGSKIGRNLTFQSVQSLFLPCLGFKLVFSFNLNTSYVRGTPICGTTGVTWLTEIKTWEAGMVKKWS